MAGGKTKKACKCCSQEGLRRGVWSAQEDKILTTYINVHGEGKWRKLPLKAGLRRCGRSCRLRWLNYLRPDIKRGDISSDEEDLIVRLHKLLGNRWSLIAGRLPGRTDNEIKNYWNTHLIKKLQGKKLKGERENSKTKKTVSKEEQKVKEENNPDFVKASLTEPEGNQVDFNNNELELGGDSSPLRVYDSLSFHMDLEMDEFLFSDFLNSDFLQVHCNEIPTANNATGGDDGINKNSSYCFIHSFPSHEIIETDCNSVQSSSTWDLDKLSSFLGLDDERHAID